MLNFKDESRIAIKDESNVKTENQMFIHGGDFISNYSSFIVRRYVQEAEHKEFRQYRVST